MAMSREAQFRMHAATPMNDEHDLARLGVDVGDNLMNVGSSRSQETGSRA
jgi:hypothetical protein